MGRKKCKCGWCLSDHFVSKQYWNRLIFSIFNLIFIFCVSWLLFIWLSIFTLCKNEKHQINLTKPKKYQNCKLYITVMDIIFFPSFLTSFRPPGFYFTVNVQKPNVRFDKPNKKVFRSQTFGFQTFGTFGPN